MVSEDSYGFYHPIINHGYVSRQQAPNCYDMNASIYAYRSEFISSDNTKKVFDGRATVWIMKDTAVLDIDNEEDLELMQVLAKYFYDKYKDYNQVYQGITEVL
jgi:CMP-N,N'-diacetyllegionaminic acid synthase